MAAADVMTSMSADASRVLAADAFAADAADGFGCMFEALLDELLWLALGFAFVKALIYARCLPQFNLFGLFAPVQKPKNDRSKTKVAVEKHADIKEDPPTPPAETRDPLMVWKAAKESEGSLTCELLKECARALATADSETAVAELAAHLQQHVAVYPQPGALNAVLEALAQQPGGAALASELLTAVDNLGNARTREILVEAFATAGDEAKVLALLKDDPSARNMAVAVRGFVRSGRLEAAAGVLAAAADRGLALPPRAAGQWLRAALAKGPEVLLRQLRVLGDRAVEAPVDCFAELLGDCLRREDLALAEALEALAFRQEGRPFAILEPLLKLHAKAGTPRAAELFDELLKAGLFASEGLCGNLLARCGDNQNLKFAEIIVGYLRHRKMMSLSIFKTLMKVYATCGRYDDACDLYEQVLAEGLEPDEVMCGCLVKFAIKCGRRQFSQDIFSRSKGGADVPSCMCMLRAAGQDGDVGRAIKLLRDLEASQPAEVDVTLYNTTVDVCVTNGSTGEAQALLREMASKGIANLVTYNTLMKGYCSNGDVKLARGVLRDMERAGLAPDSASYNCLLGAYTGAGNFAEVWSTMDEMLRKGVPVDHYTVSIMMKVAKRANPRDAARALTVLDQGVNVCGDEVVLNSVLDALIARHDMSRLTKVLCEHRASDFHPTVHTYGLLIKANSMLKRVPQCLDLWREMVDTRGLVPNTITLSCMLDALVCTRQVDRAVDLFKEWKAKVSTNTIMYSTLIKGFATSGQPDQAMEMRRQLLADGLEMNLVAYTSLIDAHARVGKMSEAMALLKAMQDEGVEPNVITYSAIVKGYCKEGDLRAAFETFEAMRSRGLSPDIVVINTLLDGCVRHSGFEFADALLESMDSFGLEPSNFTTSIIVKMWGKRRRLDDAFATVRRAAAAGGRCLDTQVGTCLISACFLNQAPERAMEALAQMKSWKSCGGPDASSYSTLISGLARKDLVRDAAAAASEAAELGLGVALWDESLQLLQRALQRRGLEELWEDLQQRLRSSAAAGAAPRPSAGRPGTASAAPRPMVAAAAGSLTGGIRGSGSGGGGVRGRGGASSGSSHSTTSHGSAEDWMSARKAAANRR